MHLICRSNLRQNVENLIIARYDLGNKTKAKSHFIPQTDSFNNCSTFVIS